MKAKVYFMALCAPLFPRNNIQGYLSGTGRIGLVWANDGLKFGRGAGSDPGLAALVEAWQGKTEDFARL